MTTYGTKRATWRAKSSTIYLHHVKDGATTPLYLNREQTKNTYLYTGGMKGVFFQLHPSVYVSISFHHFSHRQPWIKNKNNIIYMFAFKTYQTLWPQNPRGTGKQTWWGTKGQHRGWGQSQIPPGGCTDLCDNHGEGETAGTSGSKRRTKCI